MTLKGDFIIYISLYMHAQQGNFIKMLRLKLSIQVDKGGKDNFQNFKEAQLNCKNFR